LESEAEDISSQTCLPIEDFAQELVTKTPYIYEVKKPKDGKCFFLKDNQCNIYKSRPLICRFYPFELKFNQEKNAHSFDFTQECPAIGKGKIFTRKDFEELFLLAKQRLL